jgi:hypothetical protein
MQPGPADYPVIQLQAKLDAGHLRDIEVAVNAWAAQRPPNGLVVHFLGEFIRPNRRAELSKRWGAYYRDRAGAFPVFVVWETTWADELHAFLGRLVNDRLFLATRDWLGRFLNLHFSASASASGARGSKLLAQPGSEDPAGIFDAPPPDGDLSFRERIWNEIQLESWCVEDELKEDPAFSKSLDELNDKLMISDPNARPTELPEEILAELHGMQSGGRGPFEHLVSFFGPELGKIIWRIGRRWSRGRDHGLWCTIVEELLRGLYLSRLAIGRRRDAREGLRRTFHPGGAGARLVNRIKDHLTAQPGTVTVVGQEVGAEGAQWFLQHLLERMIPEMPSRLALIAPAVDFPSLWETLLIGFDRCLAGVKIYGLEDAKECLDAYWPGVYPRSVMYFASGLLDENGDLPLVGMERFHSGRRPFDDDTEPVIGAFRQLQRRRPVEVVWAPHSPDSLADCHSAWENDATTQASLAEFVSAGRTASG